MSYSHCDLCGQPWGGHATACIPRPKIMYDAACVECARLRAALGQIVSGGEPWAKGVAERALTGVAT